MRGAKRRGGRGAGEGREGAKGREEKNGVRRVGGLAYQPKLREQFTHPKRHVILLYWSKI